MSINNISVNDQTLVQQPWWLSLPENFNQSRHMTDIDLKYRLKIQSAAAIDNILRTGLASAVLASMSANLFSAAKIKKDVHNLEFYADLVDRGDAKAVFQLPLKDIKITRERLAHSSYFPEGAQVELLRTPSTYKPLNPTLRAEFAQDQYQLPAVAQHWRHPDGARPTLIFTHGFLADAPCFNSLMFSLGWFFKQGYDILLHTLPFHGLRRRKVDIYSGMGLFSHGFSYMNEALLQSVYDLRVWMDYLETQGVTKMGACGYSLGGYTTALAACADSRLKFTIVTAPAVLLIDMIKGWGLLNLGLTQMMKSSGLSLADLRYLTAIHCPLTWQPVLAAERLMVIGGAGDRFTSPQFVNILHQHWFGSQMHWFPGNHLMHLHQPAYLRLMKKFIDQACTD